MRRHMDCISPRCGRGGNRTNLGGVHGAEGRLGHHDVEFGVVE
jgi:hypothetical protein